MSRHSPPAFPPAESYPWGIFGQMGITGAKAGPVGLDLGRGPAGARGSRNKKAAPVMTRGGLLYKTDISGCSIRLKEK